MLATKEIDTIRKKIEATESYLNIGSWREVSTTLVADDQTITDLWLNRILSYILIGALRRILWVDIKTGITTDALWNTFGGVSVSTLLSSSAIS